MNTRFVLDTPIARFLEEQELPELQREIREIRRIRQALDTHERLVNLAIQMKLPETGRQPSGTKPVLREAILLIMRENDPDKIWTRDTMLSQLRERQWDPGGRTPENQVGNRLGEMSKHGEVEQVGRGQYRARFSSSATDNDPALALGA
jgi:hypothetical protein